MARTAHFDHDTIAPAAAASAGTKARTPGLKALVARLRQALEVRRQRRALMGMCERMRNDIGLSQADVYREVNRPFLDVPVDTGPMKFSRPCSNDRRN